MDLPLKNRRDGLRASIPEPTISGAIEISVELSDENGAKAAAIETLLFTWVRATEIGFFGPGRVRNVSLETRGMCVFGRFECLHVSHAALHVLSKMIRRRPRLNTQVGGLDMLHDGQVVTPEWKEVAPPLPQSIPFLVEYPEDLKPYVRIEIEFGRELEVPERGAIFDALSIWDVLIETLEEERPEERYVRYENHLLSPAIVEHQVDGYYADFKCFDYIVWMGLRLRHRLRVDRITME